MRERKRGNILLTRDKEWKTHNLNIMCVYTTLMQCYFCQKIEMKINNRTCRIVVSLKKKKCRLSTLSLSTTIKSIAADLTPVDFSWNMNSPSHYDLIFFSKYWCIYYLILKIKRHEPILSCSKKLYCIY